MKDRPPKKKKQHLRGYIWEVEGRRSLQKKVASMLHKRGTAKKREAMFTMGSVPLSRSLYLSLAIDPAATSSREKILSSSLSTVVRTGEKVGLNCQAIEGGREIVWRVKFASFLCVMWCSVFSSSSHARSVGGGKGWKGGRKKRVGGGARFPRNCWSDAATRAHKKTLKEKFFQSQGSCFSGDKCVYEDPYVK